MDKEQLLKLGLTEEQAKQILSLLGANYAEKTKLDELEKENTALKQTVTDRDKQLDKLKKTSGDSEELKKQIELLQQQNAEQKKAHDAEMLQLKLDNAVETALTAAGAKNVKAVRSLLDAEKIKLGEDGKIGGLKEQIDAVKKSDPYMFAEKENPSLKGFQPGASGDVKPDAAVDLKDMTYSQMVSYSEKNPDAKFD